jgi:predicted secreted acid phosphatase
MKSTVRRQYRLLASVIALCLFAVIGPAHGQSDPNESSCRAMIPRRSEAVLLRYEESGQYQHDIKDAVDKAKTYLTQHSAEKGKLAMVLDIDETALSNWPQLKADDFKFFLAGPCNISVDGKIRPPCGWNKWVALEKSLPIVPTLELYGQARSHGVRVFFITGRTEAQRVATAANLGAAGYEGLTDSDLIMKPTDSHPKSLATFKTAARKAIANAGYVIVLNVGDQCSDLSGDYARKPIKLPNPFYYVP